MENTDVNFTMSTTSGGLSLTPVTGKSNSDGYVSTTINAGTVTSVVSVTATIVDKNISTSSNTLTVSTGVPVQRNTSLSIETFNPPAWETDGVEVKVTMRMADDFGNPVLDNTGVTFWTEGGAIGSNCLTKNGSCEVKWISQDFRPNNGRVTILAFATGNETFIDSNTNGRYDLNESFSDLGEAFRDDNENNLYDFPEELFVDLTDKSNGNAPNGSYELNGDGVYSGTLCYLENSSICTREKITVRKSAIIAMSSWVGKFSLFTDQMCTVASNGFLAASSPTLYVLAEDRNGNSLPNGTKLTAENATGLTAKLDATIPNTSEPGCFPILLTGSSGSTGRFTVQSKTAKNEISTATYDITFN